MKELSKAFSAADKAETYTSLNIVSFSIVDLHRKVNMNLMEKFIFFAGKREGMSAAKEGTGDRRGLPFFEEF